ncbi:MAG TPA: DUF4159 domain-containing protein [Xanthobacteraceae bacterium]|nr:DUF4159 domain-containing protein [Xanthobacteraceae bacterium]
MIAGLPLGFAQPLVLLGLISLPILWWLLRLMPPRPRRIAFPPTRLLFEIAPREETPARTPWWLTLLRLLLAALVIVAAAGPLWNPPLATSGESIPLAILIDDGWTAAATWDARMRTAEEVIARAEAGNRGVAIVPFSTPERDISLETPGAARVRLRALTPKPYAVDRGEAVAALTRFLKATPRVEFIWLSDGIDLGQAKGFVNALAGLREGQPIMVVDGGLKRAQALAAADNAAGALTVEVLRPTTGTDVGLIRALDLKGLTIGEAGFQFPPQARETQAQFDLPVEIRNDIARLEIVGERSAGAVQLLDKRWRRRTVGVVSGASTDTAQPLLDATYYLARALNPFADVRLAEGKAPAQAVEQFLDQNLPMLILADVGTVVGEARERLTRWIDEGGVLVRFAGPRLAAGDDDLVPVRLRRGGRTLGGSLTWEQPQQLGSFSRDSPFAGMAVPNDATVRRQVLAEPDSELSGHTWATLADGTPLVTAERRGKGEIVLFHVTADTRWSDLPLSGAFVEMLKRIVALSGSTPAMQAETHPAAGAQEVIPPSRVLDGFGAFEPPPPTARPVPAGFGGRGSADHPPGFYGPPEGLLAVNTLAPSDQLGLIDFSPLGAQIEPYRQSEPVDLRGSILLSALGLLGADSLLVLAFGGGLRSVLSRRRRALPVLILAGVMLGALLRPAPALADQAGDAFAMKATLETHLAYVVTGDAEVDAISKSGLQGLTLFLAQRTALEAGEPIGVDIGRDELAFFPLIYWPIAPNAPKPSAEALARADAYMKQGGTILFDTRDAVEAPPGPGGETRSPGMMALRSILSALDIPELEPVPRDHVLTKTFFLLRDFPGRFSNGQLWVEATPPQSADDEPRRPVRGGDGVSSILITSDDFAGAWAIRPDGQPMLPLVPGDSGDPRQREFAFRAGVNIVMYTLTGNYKADQVHIPALLERLGQ